MSALYIFRNLNDILLHSYHILYILHVIYEIEYCTRERPRAAHVSGMKNVHKILSAGMTSL